ncbi:MAG: Gfo/Idh/MocA family oxidoreductase [Candidatus Omnitrophota bacterium]
MNDKNRRNFLKTAAGTTVGMSAMIRSSAWASANETIRMCVVGLNGRGKDHISGFDALENVEVAAMCDVDESILNARADQFKAKMGREVKKFTDVRDALADSNIDAISVATPNHWHSLIGIWACQAGKDAYIEKPLSHNIYEGRKLVEAARKYNRIVQHGTQIRSSAAVQEAIQMLHDGYIGEVYYAKGTCYKWRNTIERRPEEPVPNGVHYNEWLGPAPDRPFSRNRFHYNWHWHWDYGNGDYGNQGVHQVDIARWGLGVGMPDLASAIGGHFMFDDDQETPNTMVCSYKYKAANKMLVFEVRHWMSNDELEDRKPGDNIVGNLFLGSKGIMIIPNYSSYKIFMGKNHTPDKAREEGGNHWANFINAVRSRNYKDLNADVEEGHLSAALCHLANASCRVERTLKIDPISERAIDDDEANALLTRNYRSPFVVPEKV